MHFGEHVTIDGYGGDEKRLKDRARVLAALKKLPEQLGMRILASPRTVRAHGNTKKDPGGWSGYVIIEESHISIHTFPKRGFLTADVYSCKNNLDVKAVEHFFYSEFSLRDIETHFLKRGTRYPDYNIY